jgi:hypothetical protein
MRSLLDGGRRVWSRQLVSARLVNPESRFGERRAIQARVVFCRIANEFPSNSSRHSKSKHNAIPRSKHFYFSMCKPFAIPPGKLALLLCWPFRVSFSSAIHFSLPRCIRLMLTCTAVMHKSALKSHICMLLNDDSRDDDYLEMRLTSDTSTLCDELHGNISRINNSTKTWRLSVNSSTVVLIDYSEISDDLQERRL